MHRKFNRIAPKFENVTFRDYCDVYLAKDVLLLVDEFETFLNTCLKHLDPAPFYEAPGLAWQALLKRAFDYYEP